jgi:hypothetical protein
MHETELEQAHRLVAQGDLTIERQRAVIEYLEASGHHELAAKAQALLKEVLAIQAEHLIRMRRLSDGRDRKDGAARP